MWHIEQVPQRLVAIPYGQIPACNSHFQSNCEGISVLCVFLQSLGRSPTPLSISGVSLVKLRNTNHIVVPQERLKVTILTLFRPKRDPTTDLPPPILTACQLQAQELCIHKCKAYVGLVSLSKKQHDCVRFYSCKARMAH